MNAPLRRLGILVGILFLTLMASSTYIQAVDKGSLDARPGNARTLYKQFGRDRGPLLVAGDAVAQSVPSNDAYGYLRTYPGGAMYSHVTGYYSIIYGATGMEDAVNGYLAGTADQLFTRRLRDLLTGTQNGGAAVELTINPRAQKAAYRGLGDQRGAAVALDPRTGAVLALVSTPGFDPALLAGHNGARVIANRKKLLAEPSQPLENRAIAGGEYPPGSTFKLVVAAAALSDGRWTPTSELDGPAQLDLPQTTAALPNDNGRACGANNKVTMDRALAISCNTAFASLGMKLGENAIAQQAAAFGFGQRIQIPLTVSPSVFPTDLTTAQVAQSSIGQFDVRATPLQMAMVTAAIANGGVLMHPQLVKSVRSINTLDVISSPAPQKLSQPVSATVADQLKTMMEHVVSSGTGTTAQLPGITVGGKTGTAQTSQDVPPTVWFTAFGQKGDQSVAVAVVVEDGGDVGAGATGGRVAAPIARSMIKAVLG